jgi:transmembrane sensor
VNKEHISTLLKHYVENTIDRNDYEELMHYISRSESDQALFKLMEAVWDEMNEDHSFDDIRSEFLYQKIVADPRFELNRNPPKKKIVFAMRPWIAIAASLLIFIGIGIGINYVINKPAQLQAIVYQEKTVPLGRKMQIELSDGTQVWVNSGSKLRFPLTFTGKKRELFLEGEAYFDVVHDASKPFIIHTGKVITQVLGTAFNVKAYNSNELKVTVVRGKVSVGLRDHLLGVLTPNQCLSYDKENNTSKQYNVDASKLKWMNGDLIFDNSKMGDAAEILERWYNVKIVFGDPKIKSRQFTTSFLHNENINQVLKVLSEFNHFNYTQEGRNFTINDTTNK